MHYLNEQLITTKCLCDVFRQMRAMPTR